jgi:hypothetical protein
MVDDLFLVFPGRLGSTDIHETIDLTAVYGDYLAIESPRQLESKG